MRVFFFCATYYQLIVAIQLRLTIYKNYEATVWLTDHSANADAVANNLRKTGLFSKVELLTLDNEWLKFHTLPHRARLKKVLQVSLGRPRFRDIGAYDEVVFFNPSMTVYEIADSIKACGVKKIIYKRMEEGLVTCDARHSHYWNGFYNHVMRLLRRVVRREDIAKSIQGFYCFVPELCDRSFPHRPLKIPPISTNRCEFVDTLNKVFDYPEFEYEQKFIYFASSSEIDGIPNGETALIGKLADLVGKENLLVKMHPRDNRTIFSNEGIEVMSSSFIPWEVYQLTNDFSNRVFLTMSSGAFLTGAALGENDVKGVFVIPEFTDTEMSDYHMSAIDKLQHTVETLRAIGKGDNLSFQSFDSFRREYAL